jgi:hypothetical protein
VTHNVRPATLADAHALAPRLRAIDLREIADSSGMTPLAALVEGLNESSTCWAVEGKGGELIGMFGATPTPDPLLGSMWLLGTEGIAERNRVRFLRESGRYVAMLHQSYPVLFNYVAAYNHVHVNWLKWLGCKFIARHDDFGVARVPFYEFVHVAPYDPCVNL